MKCRTQVRFRDSIGWIGRFALDENTNWTVAEKQIDDVRGLGDKSLTVSVRTNGIKRKTAESTTTEPKRKKKEHRHKNK